MKKEEEEVPLDLVKLSHAVTSKLKDRYSEIKIVLKEDGPVIHALRKNVYDVTARTGYLMHGTIKF